MRRVMFWADCGPDIGLGHVMRCAALAGAARDGGLAPVLATRAPGEAALAPWRRLGAAIVGFEPVGNGAGARAALDEVARAQAADWVVIDRYGLSPSFWDAPSGVPSLVIDDEGRADPIGAVVNPNPGAERRFATDYPRAGIRLLGARFAMIRPEIMGIRPAGGGGILVTLGGGAIADATHALASTIARTLPDVPVHVLGDFPSQKTAPPNLVVRPAGDLASALAAADLVVCAGGVTALEAACLGRPLVLTILAGNQRTGAEALAEIGAARLATGHEAIAAETLDLWSRPAARAAASEAARACIDGRGATRIMAAMSAWLDGKD